MTEPANPRSALTPSAFEPVAETGVPVPAPRVIVMPALTAAVLAVPGVIGLEPTLGTIGHRILSPGSSDGIRLHTHGATTSVDINIGVDTTAPARQIAHTVQRAARSALSEHHYEVEAVTVNVLSIHPAPSRPVQADASPFVDGPVI